MRILIAVIIFSAIILIHELGPFSPGKEKRDRCNGILSWNGSKASQYGERRDTVFDQTVSYRGILRHAGRGYRRRGFARDV